MSRGALTACRVRSVGHFVLMSSVAIDRPDELNSFSTWAIA